MEQYDPETPLIPTPASSWKKSGQPSGEDLLLPSGNVARVRKISPEVFMGNGFIPDPLSEIISKSVRQKSGMPPEKELVQAVSDPKVLTSSLKMFDQVCVYAVVAPQIAMPPTCSQVVSSGELCGTYANVDTHKDPSAPGYHEYQEGVRNPNILYVDTLDMEDKVYIFNWCLGGTRDLSTFRAEFAQRLASASGGEDVQLPAQPDGGSD